MRPTDRGEAPADATTYEQMRPTLLDRLGLYCSYCEYPVLHAPHAEHVVPKDRFRAWRDRWDNLVVSCTYCNGRKGHDFPKPENLDEYLWPTRDNTARAFTYANVIPEVDRHIDPASRPKAAKLRGLVNLGVMDDERAKARAETYNLAKRYSSLMGTVPDPALMRRAIVDLAKAHGFFSVWMEAFSNDAAVRKSLIEEFAGTARDCFHPVTTQPIERPGGRL